MPPKLVLAIAGDTTALEKALSRASGATGRFGRQSETAMDKVARTSKIAGAAITGFGIATGLALLSTIPEWQNAKRSEVEMQNTIKNMPKLAGATVGSFQGLAREIMAYSAADDDAVLSAEAMLGTFHLTQKQILGITPLVVDYARKFKVDLPSAAKQVGKALDGNIGALKRNGVSIDANLFKTDKYAAVQKALGDQVGGFAKDEAVSGIVAYERMSNAISEIKEVIGEVMAGAINPLIGKFQAWLGHLQKTNPQLLRLVAVGGMVAAGLALVVGPMLLLVGVLPAIGAGFAILSPAILPVMAIIAGLAAAAYLIYTNWGTIAPWLQKTIAAIRAWFFENFGFVITWFRQNWPLIKQTVQAVIGFISGYIRAQLAIIKAVWQAVWPVLKAVLGPILSAILGIVKVGIGNVLGVIKAVMQLITGDWKGAWKTIKKTAWDTVGGMVDVGRKLVTSIWDGIKATGSWLLKQLGKWLLSQVPAPIRGAIKSALHIPGLALGGRAMAGMPKIIGERGPELFIPDRSGYVVPNNRLGGGYHAGDTYHITVVVPDGKLSTFHDEVRRAKQRGRARS